MSRSVATADRETLAASPVLRDAARDVAGAGTLKHKLFALPRHRRRIVAATNSRFHSRGLAELLLATPSQIPEEMTEAATLALAIARGLAAEDGVKRDLMARALALRAEAARAKGKLLGAAKDLKAAARSLRGLPDLLEARAAVLGARGRLRLAEGNADEALALLARAAALFGDLGERETVAAIYIEVARLHLHFAESVRALSLFEEALATSPLRPTQLFEALRGSAACLLFEGRHEEAPLILQRALPNLPSPWQEKASLLAVAQDDEREDRERELGRLVGVLAECGETTDAALAALILRHVVGAEVAPDLRRALPAHLRRLGSAAPPFSTDDYRLLLAHLWTVDLPFGE